MSQLSDNLTSRRESLGLSVEDVQRELNRLGILAAYSTVAGWFNGSRSERWKMEHLRALCIVLKTDMNGLTGESIAVVEGRVPVMIHKELDGMNPESQELVLALIRNMKGTKG